RTERGEMTLNIFLPNIGKRGRPPARLVVLVDDHCAHAFVEIMPMDDARHYAEFHLHARLEIPGLAATYLRQRQLEAQWRFCTHGGSRPGSPFGVGASARGFAVERGQDVLHHVAGKEAV